MQAKTDHKRGFVWGLAFAVTMTISSIWGQAVSSGQFVRAAQVKSPFRANSNCGWRKKA